MTDRPDGWWSPKRAGPPEPEVVITPEMTRAGSEALELTEEEELSVEATVIEVYRVMRKLERIH